MVVSILKDANKKLKGKLQNCENEMKISYSGSETGWSRLHNIHLNGHQLEYVGGSLANRGSALAKTPLSKSSHYFEMEIIDPGSSRYIAIGLASKDYPREKWPGYSEGSIGYHADDGQVYMGTDVGELCNKGDIMGCGVIFPSNYECKP